MRRLLVFIVFVLVVLIGYSYWSGIDGDGAGDVIKIGYIGPLTGNAAAYGQDAKRATEMYFVNHSMIEGRSVEVIYEDTQCSSQMAASAVAKLINIDGVQAILGGQCSSETLGAAPLADQNKVIVLSPLSTSPEISTAGDFVFRNVPSDKVIAVDFSKEISSHFRKVAMVTESTDYAEAYRDQMVQYLKEVGVELSVDEKHLPDATEFKTILQKVKDSDAEVLVIMAQTAVTNGLMVKQSHELGLDLPIYGNDTMLSQQYLDIAKNAADGTRMVVVSADETREDVQAFLDEFGEVQSSKAFVLLAYDAAEILGNAIEKVGYDGTLIRDYFYTMDLFKGLAGDVTFDENGDNNISLGKVMEVKNGEFVLLDR